MISFDVFFYVSVSIAVARVTSDSSLLLAQCAVKLLDASKNLTMLTAAVYVSTSPEVTHDFRSELLLAVHRNYHPALLLHRFDVKPFNPSRHISPHAYLVAARGVSDLTSHLDTINVTAGSWRPDTNFVVVLETTVASAASLEPVIKRFWTNFMLKSVLLVPSCAVDGSPPAVDAFVWYPFRESCGRRHEPTAIGTCAGLGDEGDDGHAASTGRWNASTAFGSRVPDVFAGCAVNVAGFYWPPMTVLSNRTPATMSYGMDVETVRLMGRAGNVTLAFREVAHNQRWGVKSANGSWNGGFGELSAHRSDMLIGGGILTAERLEMFDCAATRQVMGTGRKNTTVKNANQK